jgi:putative Mg2+ transporter-C (MgtC) family protein
MRRHASGIYVMDILLQSQTLALLALTFLLSAIIGVEREWHGHGCGIRPCVLVAVGAAAYSNFVTGRLPDATWGAGFGAIVTGVGFLGAGAILKEDRRRVVHGLSTAATIWAVAIFGLLIGAYNVTSGATLAILVLMVNILLRPAAEFIARRSKLRRTTEDILDG